MPVRVAAARLPLGNSYANLTQGCLTWSQLDSHYAGLVYFKMLLRIAIIVAATSSTASADSFVAGRIVFTDGDKELSVAEVERTRWGRVSVDLRQGRQVQSARPDDSGMLFAPVASGVWRIEYVVLGEQAVFFAPRDVKVPNNKIACVGTFVIPLPRQSPAEGAAAPATGPQDSAVAAKDVTVRDDCKELAPKAQAEAGVKMNADVVAVPIQLGQPYSIPRPLDLLLIGLRAEIGFLSTGQTLLQGRYEFPHHNTFPGANSWFVGVMGGLWVKPDSREMAVDYEDVWVGSVDAGYSFWLFEVRGEVGYIGAGGPFSSGVFAGPSILLDLGLLGIGGQHVLAPEGRQVSSVFFTLSPVAILGALL